MSGKNKSLNTQQNNNNINNDDDDDDVDLIKLKERFDKQLPKYGFLWRSMANAQLNQRQQQGTAITNGGGGQCVGVVDDDDKENCNNNISASSTNQPHQQQPHTKDAVEENSTQPFLNAILNKQPISLRIPTKHMELCNEEEDCNCAEPIVEIDDDDENASVYDVDLNEELADTDDEELGSNSSSNEKLSSKLGEGCDDNNVNSSSKNNIIDEESEVEIDDDGDDSSISSDESVLIISKTPKKKKTMFIIDSDDDDSEGEEDENGSIEQDIDKSDDDNSVTISDATATLDQQSNAKEKESIDTSPPKRSTRLRNLKSKSKTLQIDSDSDDIRSTTSSEEEWIELSSDEEDDVSPPKQVNTVVILSDDEEVDDESYSGEAGDANNHSIFTLSSDDDSASDSSIDIDSNGPRFRKTTTGGRKPASKKTSDGSKVTEPTKSSTIVRSNTNTFRKNRDTLTSHTFDEFNHTAFQGALSSVKVTWSNKLNTTAGITRMKGKLGKDKAHSRVATIELATKVIDDEERLRSTLLHEMCHAAQWLVDGTHKPPHGAIFKKWASVAMRKIRDVEVTTTHDYQITYKYAWACTASICNVVIKRHSRSVDPTKHCCGQCQGKLMEIEVPGTKGDTVNNGYTPKKTRKTSEFALFVKNQSNNVRNRLATERACAAKSISQADVMKECGRLWRRKKASADGGLDLESMADKLVNLTLTESP